MKKRYRQNNLDNKVNTSNILLNSIQKSISNATRFQSGDTLVLGFDIVQYLLENNLLNDDGCYLGYKVHCVPVHQMIILIWSCPKKSLEIIRQRVSDSPIQVTAYLAFEQDGNTN